MCGIAGVFHYAGGEADGALVARMTRAQRHRGPDDAGLWCDGPAALGHRRLSIVDVSPGGHQPLANEDGSVWVAFNGELYNWPEARRRLLERGHSFRGGSDTEMLVHLWEDAGPALLERLRGMFAFALVDVRRRTLLLGRDRVGKKPLFYHDDGRRIAFASELKGLMLDPTVPRDVDERSVVDFLAHQYVPGPRTIFAGVRKLPAGHRLVCDAAGPRVERYWALPVGREAPGRPAEAVDRLRDLLLEAVRVRLMSDVPLGAFLSGGIDSSAVVALMTRVSPGRVKTYSIGFDDERTSELGYARRVASHLGTDHHEFVVHPQALDLLPRLVWGMDEPFADVSMIPTFHVAEMARREVTVALSGDGGDEAFAGYSTYPRAVRDARWDVLAAPLKPVLRGVAGALPPGHALGRRLRRLGLDAGRRHLEGMSQFEPREIQAVLAGPLRASAAGHDPHAGGLELYERARRAVGPVPALLALDAQTYLIDDVLAKVDRTSMLNSLEVRAPLLDHVVLEYVATLPFELKLRGGTSKWALREAVRPWLPPEILARGKQGFGVPLPSWFGRDFGRLAREVLLDSRTRARGWLDAAGVERVLGRAAVQRDRYPWQAFTLVCLELWAQTWLDRPRASLDSPTDGECPLHPAVAGRSVT